MLGTFNDIVSQKGIFALYQGVVPYLIGDGLSGAVKFAVFELAQRYLEKRIPEKYLPYTRFLCAAFAMLVCSVILVPGEVLKTRLQAGAVRILYNSCDLRFLKIRLLFIQGVSLMQAVNGILATEGIRGLFVGYYATLVRDIPYTMLELGIYENLKVVLAGFRVKNEEVTAAAVTGAVAAFITTPLDLVKTKLMMQAATGGKYSGVVDAITRYDTMTFLAFISHVIYANCFLTSP